MATPRSDELGREAPGLAPDIQALTSAGRHEEAAELLIARGDARRAAELLSTVWQHARAVEVAGGAGLYVEAYQYALTSRDRALEQKALDDLLLEPGAAREAVGIATARRRPGDAARLLAAAGELASAAERFEEAGELAAAAELRERAGDLKGAGRLYERHLSDHPEDAVAALALGRILLHFGRTEHAVRALQAIEDHHELGLAARQLLVAAFDKLGLPDAASSVLDRLRADDPSLPPTVAGFLARHGGPASDAGRELVLGRYRIERTLGAGGTGRVLLAEDTFFGRPVAIKVLSAVEGARGRDALVRFAREARLSASLEHPSIVRTLDYHGAGPFLIMEWMAGGTLEERLFPAGAPKDGPMTPLSPAVARPVLSSVLRALDAAHRRGVVHRDLKPANVFFGSAGEVKLGDFGAAHLLDLGATRTGALIGTVAYMAPEQIASSAAIHPATDLYACAVLAYVTLAGVLPYEGSDHLEQHLRGTPRGLAEVAPPWLAAVPDGLSRLEALLLAMLDKRPEARPESALDVDAVLQALPWDAWQRAYDASGGVMPLSSRTSAPPASPTPTLGRYHELEGVERRWGTRRARDELLDREVELLAVTPEERAHLVRFAKIGSPFVQAIYAEGEGMLVLEAMPPAASSLDATALAQLAEGLAAVHGAGLAHGAISREAIGVADGRAVLALPLHPVPASRDADLAALSALR